MSAWNRRIAASTGKAGSANASACCGLPPGGSVNSARYSPVLPPKQSLTKAELTRAHSRTDVFSTPRSENSFGPAAIRRRRTSMLSLRTGWCGGTDAAGCPTTPAARST
jgi:hypothetical protein